MHDQSGEMVYVTSNDVRVYVQLLPIENGSFFFCNHAGRLTFVGSFKGDLFLYTWARYIITMGIKETFFTIALYKEYQPCSNCLIKIYVLTFIFPSLLTPSNEGRYFSDYYCLLIVHCKESTQLLLITNDSFFCNRVKPCYSLRMKEASLYDRNGHRDGLWPYD